MKRNKSKRRTNLFIGIGWGSLLPTVLSAVIGILMVSVPEGSLQAFCISAGILLALSGAVFLVVSFLGEGTRFFLVPLSAAVIALAVWLFADGSGAMSAIVAIFAVFLLLRAVVGLWGALAVKRSGGNWWKVQTGGSLILAVIAVVFLFRPIKSLHLLMVLIGVFLLFDAIMEFLSLLRGIAKRRVPLKEEVREEEPKQPKQPKE